MKHKNTILAALFSSATLVLGYLIIKSYSGSGAGFNLGELGIYIFIPGLLLYIPAILFVGIHNIEPSEFVVVSANWLIYFFLFRWWLLRRGISKISNKSEDTITPTPPMNGAN